MVPLQFSWLLKPYLLTQISIFIPKISILSKYVDFGKFAASDSAFAAKVYDFLSPPFYALYTLVRGFAGPAFVYKMFVFYVSGGGDGVVPKWAWISWIFVVFMAISVIGGGRGRGCEMAVGVGGSGVQG
ncbi:hypothetical protein Leryth_010875 [Lithospermum erythrorhizon]|nr:hypothetical protein Leryth_010875 [Lithospermum erythrorhizon]